MVFLQEGAQNVKLDQCRYWLMVFCCVFYQFPWTE